jgi:hypothetical protein
MNWTLTASLLLLGLLMVGLLVLSLVIGVGKYVKRFADPAAKPKPRGFEVKPPGGGEPPAEAEVRE